MAKDETTKKKKPTPSADRDELAEIIATSLNKLNKDGGQVAYFLDGEESTPTDFTDFISTGATMLDIAIANRPHGGIAVGRITELTGLEGSGKSLVGASMIADTQKRGGIAVLIDTETAVNAEFYTAIGVNMKKLVYANLITVEDIFDAIVDIIERVRTNEKKDKLVTIVVDSVAAASTKAEIEGAFAKEGYGMEKAYLISKAMRKITGLIGSQRIALVFTNQLRQKLNAPAFSDPWTTSGGKAIAFHASTRIRLSQTGKLKDSDGNIVGVSVKADIVKNRLGPPHRKAEFNIYFNRGIDDNSSWLDVLSDIGVVKKSGSWYTYEDIKFQSKEFASVLEADPARKEVFYNAICDALIMKYQTEFDPDTISAVGATDDE
jgi:recombination protein RecA